jgi:hypothetical protein
MKKLAAVVLLALAIAFGLWFAWRIEQAHRRLSVAELLPKSTLLFVAVPDFNRARERWHTSDLDALWREPSVQAWLQKPLATWRDNRAPQAQLEDFLQLKPTNGFVALTSIDANEPKLIGGFRFNVSGDKAREFIDARRAALMKRDPSFRRATLTYNQRDIETMTSRKFTLASAFAGDWFFVSNNVASLQALIDRADRRAPQTHDSLRESDAFKSAIAPLPTDYAATFFFDPQPFVQKLLPVVAMTGQTFASAQLQKLNEMRGLAGTLGFDHGKMRGTVFAVMPRVAEGKKLTRPSLTTAGANTFFYFDSLTNWNSGSQLAAGAAAGALPAFLTRFSATLVRLGISTGDFRAAFGDELEWIGQWPPATRWPSVLATMTVKDPARAKKIIDALASAQTESESWTRSEKDGITFYTLPSLGTFAPIAFTIALSEKKLVVSTDAGAVETALLEKPPAGDTLAASRAFREASGTVAKPDTAFSYIDTRMIFERADATLRPMLLLAATFNRSLNSKLNASQLPPADDIAKHLSPIVMSQRYTSGGYLTESTGPITFNQAVFVGAGSVGALYVNFHKSLGAGNGLIGKLAPNLAAPSTATPTPTPSVSPTP